MCYAVPLLVSVIASLLISNSVQAFTYIGGGATSCATRSEERGNPSAALQDEQWVLGFLSGIGYVAPGDIDPLKGLHARAVWSWVDVYCQAHPREDLFAAAAAFYRVHPR